MQAPASGLSPRVTLLCAVACGLAVANVYYAQPLLDLIAADFQIRPATVGIVVTATQIGYGVGLLLVVPLGDRLDRRRLIAGQFGLSSVALLVAAVAPTPLTMLVAMTSVGVLAVVAQVIVAYAATVANPAERGRVVGTVTSGIIVGIMMARAAAGFVADVGGWRAVFATSAVLTLAMAVVLLRALPRAAGPPVLSGAIGYRRLVGTVIVLLVREPVLRLRAVLALLIFAAATALLTPMVLELSAAPYSLSHAQVGLFGLAGAAGALGAARAGRRADTGHAQRSTGVGLAVMLCSWLPIALLPVSVWWLVLGVVTIDYGLQSVHVSNQSLILQRVPGAQSRLTGGYMLFYSVGSAAGALASTLVYAHAGWHGVSLLGVTLSAVALAFWAVTLHRTTHPPKEIHDHPPPQHQDRIRPDLLPGGR